MPGETMAERIREARLAAKLSQEDLADEVGVRGQTIWRYEAGESRPRGEQLVKLAAALGRSPEWIVSGEEPARPPESRVEREAEVPATIEQAIEEMRDRLSAETIEKARETDWHGGAPSLGTARSYLLDLELEAKGKAKAAEPIEPPKRRPGRVRLERKKSGRKT